MTASPWYVATRKVDLKIYVGPSQGDGRMGQIPFGGTT